MSKLCYSFGAPAGYAGVGFDSNVRSMKSCDARLSAKTAGLNELVYNGEGIIYHCYVCTADGPLPDERLQISEIVPRDFLSTPSSIICISNSTNSFIVIGAMSAAFSWTHNKAEIGDGLRCL